MANTTELSRSEFQVDLSVFTLDEQKFFKDSLRKVISWSKNFPGSFLERSNQLYSPLYGVSSEQLAKVFQKLSDTQEIILDTKDLLALSSCLHFFEPEQNGIGNLERKKSI